MRLLVTMLFVFATTSAAADERAVTALANAAASCELESVGFDVQCKAWLAWNSEYKLFEGGKANAQLTAWLGHADPKYRLLAVQKLVQLSPEAMFGARKNAAIDDPKIAARVLQVAATERTGALMFELGKLVAMIDIPKVKLGAEQLALTSHPDQHFRSAIADAIRLMPNRDSAALIVKLLADSNRNVRWSALDAIGRIESLGKLGDIVCPGVASAAKTLPADARGVELLAKTGCPEMLDLAPAWVAKRAGDKKFWDEDRARLGVILGAVCARGNDKQLQLAVKTAQDLLAPNKPSYTRIGGAMALHACRERIEVDDLLQKLTNDRDREVADEAKRALRRR